MIRRVAFKKACIGGAAGALALEPAARVLLWSGLPAFDLVQFLGALAFGTDPGFSVRWAAGLFLRRMTRMNA